jgi:ATP-dependent protease Clp ATPase subunit
VATSFTIDRGDCAFCGTTSEVVVAAPSSDRRICPSCVGLCREILTRDDNPAHEYPCTLCGALEHSCSFCSEREGDVNTLICGPHVFICDGCIAEASATLR